MSTREPAGSQAVDRALALLALFDDRRETLTIGEAAAALDVHRSTASRLLAALVRGRLLTFDASRSGYVLSLGLLSLAGRALTRYPVRSAATDIVRELRDETGETAWIGVPSESDVVFVDQASSREVQIGVDWVGRSQPLSAGVAGRLLLAFRTDLLAGLPAGAASVDAKELQGTRRLGYLARVLDPASEHAAVAVPIRDHRNEVVAAVAVSGPPQRVDSARLRDELTPATLRAGSRISERLGLPAV